MKNKTLWKQVGAAAIAAAMVMSTVPATPVQAAGGKTLAVSSQKQLNQALKTVIPVKSKTKEIEKAEISLAQDYQTPEKWQELLEHYQKKHAAVRIRLVEALMKQTVLNQEYVKNISIYEITDFPNHPFKVKMDDKMLETIESVRDHGVLVPALVREKPTGGYEMISGHRRKMASELAGKETMPCIVRNLSDDQAVIVMVDSNLQREEILPSEKAFAYKMKLEAMKRQAGRPRKNSVPVAQEFQGKTSREILGEQVGESQDQIRRYIRLTELIPEILEMVDDKKISMRPAVELSYLPKEEQEILYDTMESEACTPSHAQAIKIRKFSAEGRLNEDVLLSIMSEEKPNQVEQWKIPKNRLKKYFPSGTTQQKMEETIIKALELYRKREKSRER